jgi:hypothetical protein
MSIFLENMSTFLGKDSLQTLQMYGVKVTVFFGEGCLHLA